jgi:hypothetical protein
MANVLRCVGPKVRELIIEGGEIRDADVDDFFMPEFIEKVLLVVDFVVLLSFL